MSDESKDWPEVIEVPLGDGVRPLRFRRILAGGEEDTFRMGQRGGEANEAPVTEVRVKGPLYLAEVPVTQGQFAQWTETEDYETWFKENEDLIKRTSWSDEAEKHSNSFSGHPDRPAEQVTWWEAMRFGEWLMEAGSLKGTKLVATLPGEAQWEYCCRGGKETEYFSGDGEAALGKVAWYSENAESRTHEVGGKEGNDFQLFDMHGNVWEWCLDLWDKDVARYRIPGESEGGAPTKGAGNRVLRGGSWYNTARLCRSAYRDWIRPGFRNWFFGFRLALVPGPSSQDQGPEAQAEPKGAPVEARDEPEQVPAEGGVNSPKKSSDQ